MLRQIKLLARLRLINFFGINEARYGKDKKRWRLIAMLAVYALLALVMMAYAGLISYGLVLLGAGESVPLCLAAVSCVVVLVFTLLRAGATLFDLRDYELLAALPLKGTAVIVSRFLTMYLSNAALTLGVLLPGTAVCGALLRPGALFYPMMLLGALLLPLIPMTIAMLAGMLVYFLSARMKRRNLAAVALSLLFTLLVMLLPVWLESRQPEALILGLRALLEKLRAFYPPAGWFADAVTGTRLPGYLAFALGSIAFFGAAAALVGRNYAAICAALANRRSARSFRMGEQRRSAVLAALCRRELRRFFASPIYVMNCGVGYLLAILLGVALLFGDAGALPELPIELIPRLIVFVLAFVYTLAPTTACSISMEGRQWWILKSLPLPNSLLLGGKLLANLAIALPCHLVSAALLFIALRPRGLVALWLALLPIGYILFAAALGLRINLRLPMLSWENESVPVKQGKATFFTMLGGLLSALAPALAIALAPAAWRDAISAAALALLLLLAALLYRSCLRCRLEKIG